MLTRVTAFIDWDTARRIARHNPTSGRRRLVEREIFSVQNSIAAILHKYDNRTRFRVHMRMYHGWYRGKTKTIDRKELDLFLTHNGAQRTIDTVSFEPDITFGDCLLCGGFRQHIFDTMRKREDGKDEQKMVDTALVSDLLQSARLSKSATFIVVGDDDDLLPGIFTAEAWGCKLILCRRRESDNVHLNTCGLIYRLGSCDD